MGKKDARSIVYNRFIAPFEKKHTNHIGVELEFPVVNKNGGNIDVGFVSSVMDYIGGKGFYCVIKGPNGEKLFMENDEGDSLSFDNSYNNFEFSLNHGDNLLEIHERFSGYFELVNSYFKEGGHELCARGTNPDFNKIEVNHLPFSTYDMVQKYLHKMGGEHNYPDFPAFMSSVQTHLDVRAEGIFKAYNFFSKMDFVRGLLFANSPDFEGKGFRIFRDFLWQKSGFGKCPNITGTVDKTFLSNDEIVDFFLEKGIFNRIRDGEYEVFEPILIKDYFDEPKYNALAEDIECYLSFCNVEITARGTLEVRGDCTQPEGFFFSPPAFNLGILENMDKASKVLENFFCENKITLKNSELRKIVAEGEDINLIAPIQRINRLCDDLWEVSYEGLKKRNKNEDCLLKRPKKIIHN